MHDLSGPIFVLLAIIWAGYLLPKALRRHNDDAAYAPVEDFSESLRVLGRKSRRAPQAVVPEVVTRDEAEPEVARPAEVPARPVVAAQAARDSVTASVDTARSRPAHDETPDAAPVDRPSAEAPVGAASAPVAPTMTRESARRAARRRRRVLGTLLALTVLFAGLALASVTGWTYAGLGAALVVGWLVLCRVMVRSAQTVPARAAAPVTQEEPPAEARQVVEDQVDESGDDSLWDPIPLTLPTYVGKPAARRTVRTIELTGAGVTSSGHDAEDTRIARQAAGDAEASRPPAPGRADADERSRRAV